MALWAASPEIFLIVFILTDCDKSLVLLYLFVFPSQCCTVWWEQILSHYPNGGEQHLFFRPVTVLKTLHPLAHLILTSLSSI